LSNGLKDFEDDREVDFLRQRKAVSQCSSSKCSCDVLCSWLLAAQIHCRGNVVTMSQREWRDIRWPCATATDWGACGVWTVGVAVVVVVVR
jgi:hypothetical protein